jgi:hypothetical protein
LHHGRHQPRYIGQGRIEPDEIRRHNLFSWRCYCPGFSTRRSRMSRSKLFW